MDHPKSTIPFHRRRRRHRPRPSPSPHHPQSSSSSSSSSSRFNLYSYIIHTIHIIYTYIIIVIIILGSSEMVSFCRLKVTFQGGLVEKRFVPAPSGAGELPRIWSTIMTQHAAFYWKQTNYWKKINKKNRITNHKNTNRKKNRKDQIAPERFVFVSFLFLCFYFSRETPESQICIFSLEKIEQQTKRNNKETNCGRVLCIFVFCFCLVSTLSQLASF